MIENTIGEIEARINQAGAVGAEQKRELLRLRAGEAAIYFPEDAHMSSLQAAGPQLVRKAVIKVPVPGN